MKTLKLAVVALIAVALAGCYAHDPYYSGPGPKQGIGTVLGAIGGGIAGAQFGSGTGQLIATGVGTLLGAAVGNNIGRSLDRADQAYLARASYDAFEYGAPRRWSNPQSGNYGTVDPGPVYQQGGDYCREYQQTVYIDGRPQNAYGTACREPDGSWRIV